MKKMYCKDQTIQCQCGADLSMMELIKDGEFDSLCFEENSMPEWFNPFSKDNLDSPGSGDRITIPYACHCPKCERFFAVYLVASIFAFDVYDDDCNVIASEYTEGFTED